MSHSTPTPETKRADHHVLGIHHVTAFASDARANLDFYEGVLGLRLVKKTVNFDDPGTYHLYYGDETGSPGTILTFFPIPHARRGTRGTGQATLVSFSVPEDAMGYWRDRLDAHGVPREEVESRFDEESLTFLDPDGLRLSLVAHAGAGEIPGWGGAPGPDPVPGERAVRGFHSVTLRERRPDGTALLLTEAMGLRLAGQEGGRLRFEAGDGIGSRVDIAVDSDGRPGRISAGSVHHVAWRMRDDAAQLALRDELAGHGLHPTEVLDRQYFRSVYFREPGGVLFELATDGPGFARDETVAELGSALKLPPWLEGRRESIEAALPSLAEARTSDEVLR